MSPAQQAQYHARAEVGSACRTHSSVPWEHRPPGVTPVELDWLMRGRPRTCPHHRRRRQRASRPEREALRGSQGGRMGATRSGSADPGGTGAHEQARGHGGFAQQCTGPAWASAATWSQPSHRRAPGLGQRCNVQRPNASRSPRCAPPVRRRKAAYDTAPPRRELPACIPRQRGNCWGDEPPSLGGIYLGMVSTWDVWSRPVREPCVRPRFDLVMNRV